MKKVRMWASWSFLILVGVGFALSVFLDRPSVAVETINQQMIGPSLIYEAKSAEELGLEYLTQEPEPLIAGLMDNIKYAERGVAQMTENIQVAIELGTNSPVAIRALPDGGQLTKSGYEAIGYVNSAGQAEAFTPLFLRAMFYIEKNNRGQLARMPDDDREVLVADGSGAFLQARRIPTLDLIVRPKRSEKIYLVPQTNANAICRDALNAVLNRRLKRFESQLSKPTITLPKWW